MSGPLLALAVLLPAQPALTCECHLALFAAQTEPYKATRIHTFAAVARTATDPLTGERTVSVVSISWLPATLQVRPQNLRPEPGRNLSVPESVAVAKANRAVVSVWGPYPVRPELYDLFAARAAELEGGMRYKVPDLLQDPAKAAHCVHAVTGVLPGPRAPVGAFGFGERASAETLTRFVPWITDATAAGPDVLARFGVAEDDVVRRPFGYTGPTRLEALRSSLRK